MLGLCYETGDGSTHEGRLVPRWYRVVSPAALGNTTLYHHTHEICWGSSDLCSAGVRFAKLHKPAGQVPSSTGEGVSPLTAPHDPPLAARMELQLGPRTVLILVT